MKTGVVPWLALEARRVRESAEVTMCSATTGSQSGPARLEPDGDGYASDLARAAYWAMVLNRRGMSRAQPFSGGVGLKEPTLRRARAQAETFRVRVTQTATEMHAELVADPDGETPQRWDLGRVPNRPSARERAIMLLQDGQILPRIPRAARP